MPSEEKKKRSISFLFFSLTLHQISVQTLLPYKPEKIPFWGSCDLGCSPATQATSMEVVGPSCLSPETGRSVLFPTH